MPAANNDGLPFAYRVREACDKLSISRSTLYAEIAAGRLKAVKCGSRTLIPTDAAKAWLHSLPEKAA
jgi:excisionase family DNA binding protein